MNINLYPEMDEKIVKLLRLGGDNPLELYASALIEKQREDIAELNVRLDEMRHAYESNGLTPSEVAAIAAAKKDGLLVALPCKIEDRVYRVINKWEDNPGCCACTGALGGGDCAYWKNEECTNLVEMYGDYKIIIVRFRYEHIPQFGKTVFLTCEEAEDALAARKGDNNAR